MSFNTIIDILFDTEPKETNTYTLHTNENMFPILMEILIRGTKKLYGDNISPSQISNEQFNKLKKYMQSLGYKINYNFTENEQGRIINIWFEPIKKTINCNGHVYFN